MTFAFEPDFAVNPGETLRETLAALGISQSTAADLMDVSQPYMSMLCSGRKGIGPTTALKLETLTGVRAEFWARLWAQYAVALERQRTGQTFAARAGQPPLAERAITS